MLGVVARLTASARRFGPFSSAIRYRKYADVHSPSSKEHQTHSVHHAIHQAALYIPHQGILENFVHHNPLATIETMTFKEGILHADRLQSYMSPTERVFVQMGFHPVKRVNESLVDLAAAFLDRGGAKWTPGFRNRGFLYFFASLEGLGFAGWRKHARLVSKRILAELGTTAKTVGTQPASEGHMKEEQLAERIIRENLEFFGVPPEDYEHCVRAMLQDLRGWAGMFHRMEVRPHEAPADARASLTEFAAVQSILVRASIEEIALKAGWDASRPLQTWLKVSPWRVPKEEDLYHSSAMAYKDQSFYRREELEANYERALLRAFSDHAGPYKYEHAPKLQVYTCIDDRSESIRRHLEEADPQHIETFGVAGFFGFPIQYKPIDGRDQMILAPDGQWPQACLVEEPAKDDPTKSALKYKFRKRWLARGELLWEKLSFSPLGSLVLSVLAPFSLARLTLMGFSPAMYNTIKSRFMNSLVPKPLTDFQSPYSPEQAARLLANTFRDIGTHQRFAPLVFVLGHGAASTNNPFAAAYNCGACSGRDGGPNARLLCRLANDVTVRALLAKDHGIVIPSSTHFVGGLHNTTTDIATFFDVEKIPPSHQAQFAEARQTLDKALGKNAQERCYRFMLAEKVKTPEEALRHVWLRSVDAAEVRPELNHSNNAAVLIGRRDLHKGTFLDRRPFMPSYDPYSDDAAGTNLEHVLAPALVVCSGINLEYFFSTTHVDHYGAGTKAPLNIVGNLGVLQGTAGDLRPGLPTQMTEQHTTVRAMCDLFASSGAGGIVRIFVVDSPISRVEAVLTRRPDLKKLVRNDWVRFFVRDPETGRIYRQQQGDYLLVDHGHSGLTHVPFEPHRRHALDVTHREALVYAGGILGMLGAAVVPIALFGADAMNPYGSFIAACATVLSLPVMGFSRRYLHGEFMYARFVTLCVGLLAGFNLVATAHNLDMVLAGWSLFGFSSAFLIGSYNDRPTVRNNATFAFTAYRVSDFALLVAATFAGTHTLVESAIHPEFAAVGLIVASLLKSSQFPLTSLFARSMEGPTPASALGYAGLSAHVGIVLLTSTMSMWYAPVISPSWYVYDWARVLVGSIGLITALYGAVVSKIRADRKGAIANATAATLGVLYVMIALGMPDLALILSFGHAAFRMIQIMRAPNQLTDSQDLRAALGYTPWPKKVPDVVYKGSWILRRLKSDVNFVNALHWTSRILQKPFNWSLSKAEQWIATIVSVVIAGAPFTPFSYYLDELLIELLQTEPLLAVAIMGGHMILSVILFRFLLVQVLHARRFRKKLDGTNPKK